MQVYNGQGLRFEVSAGWIPAGQTGNFRLQGYFIPSDKTQKATLFNLDIPYNGYGNYSAEMPLANGILVAMRAFFSSSAAALNGIPVAVKVTVYHSFPTATAFPLRVLLSALMRPQESISYPSHEPVPISQLSLVPAIIPLSDNTGNWQMAIRALCRFKPLHIRSTFTTDATVIARIPMIRIRQSIATVQFTPFANDQTKSFAASTTTYVASIFKPTSHSVYTGAVAATWYANHFPTFFPEGYFENRDDATTIDIDFGGGNIQAGDSWANNILVAEIGYIG